MKYRNYLTILIDILGSKAMIQKDIDATFLNLMGDVYNIISKILPEILRPTLEYDIKIKIFSDNILIAIPSEWNFANNNHPVIALNRACTVVGAIQRLFLEKGLLTRGGVSYGTLYIDDTFVLGETLLRSYELEDKIAVTPRVIVDNSIIEILSKLVLHDSNAETMTSFGLVIDDDGEYYFDYLNFPQDPICQNIIARSIVLCNEELQKLDDKVNHITIDTSLSKREKKEILENVETVKNKYLWLKKYIDYCKSQRT